MLKLTSLTILFLASMQLFSQELIDIETDRPDQTECSSVIPRKTIQIETGIVYESDDESVLYFPTSLIRIGAFKKLEVRIIAGEYYKSESKTDSLTYKTEGFSPVSLGVKAYLLKENKFLPQTAFIFHFNRDSRKIYAVATPFDFRFSMSHTLSRKIDLGYNLGGEWNEDQKIFTYIYTLTSAFSIGERFASYIEIFGDVADRSFPHHQFDAGITFLPKINIQLDCSSGIALNEYSTHLYLSAGLSWRIPN
ncbi:MAG: transporter [Bacteroidetes bacterium]|nr:transporter [Bacteroidota bacterium]